jgi:trehalose-phosphatase
VEKLVGVDGLLYAGSHGFDIRGAGFSLIQPEAKKAIPLIAETVEYLSSELKEIPGMLIEDKRFSVAVHYRLVEDRYLAKIEELVKNIVAGEPSLRLMRGKKVFEIMPAIDWNKGKAVRWIMQALGIGFHRNTVVYIGDDTTDEDAFRTLRTRGVGVLVAEKSRPSTADFRVTSPEEVRNLFKKIIK